MMGTQSKAEHGVIQSSIVLLQERFRQLQRVKEMRETREFVRMFSDYKDSSTMGSIMATSSTTSRIKINNNIIDYKDSSTTGSTMATSSTTSHIKPNNNIIDSTMQCNDEVQIFIPPNYYSNNNPKSSCYSSATTTTTTTLSTSSQNNHNRVINLNEVSLSLWPSPASYNNVGADHTTTTLRPVAAATEIIRPCLSSVYKFEDSHVSDVDTTLHL